MGDNEFTLKFFFNAYLNDHELRSQNVVFRLYRLEDDAYHCYSQNDWNLIFPEISEAQFNQWINRDDFVMLSTFERNASQPFGLLCFEVSKTSNKRAYFHGGTWQHTIKDMLLAYEGIVFILHFLMKHGLDILVTCLKCNTKANKFQDSLGFVEFGDDEIMYFKYLDIKKFSESPLVSRFL